MPRINSFDTHGPHFYVDISGSLASVPSMTYQSITLYRPSTGITYYATQTPEFVETQFSTMLSEVLFYNVTPTTLDEVYHRYYDDTASVVATQRVRYIVYCLPGNCWTGYDYCMGGATSLAAVQAHVLAHVGSMYTLNTDTGCWQTAAAF